MPCQGGSAGLGGERRMAGPPTVGRHPGRRDQFRPSFPTAPAHGFSAHMSVSRLERHTAAYYRATEQLLYPPRTRSLSLFFRSANRSLSSTLCTCISSTSMVSIASNSWHVPLFDPDGIMSCCLFRFWACLYCHARYRLVGPVGTAQRPRGSPPGCKDCTTASPTRRCSRPRKTR